MAEYGINLLLYLTFVNCNQSTIEYCNEYKYLGIYFNEFLNTTQIIDHAATSARKTSAGIIACSKMLGGLMYKSYTQLYNSLVVHIMTMVLSYGAIQSIHICQ